MSCLDGKRRSTSLSCGSRELGREAGWSAAGACNPAHVELSYSFSRLQTYTCILIKISWKQPKSSLLLTFRPLSSEEAGTRSSFSGSWRDKLVSSQESGRT